MNPWNGRKWRLAVFLMCLQRAAQNVYLSNPSNKKKIKRALRWQASPLPSTLQKIFLVQAINSMGLAEAVRRLSRLAESLSRKSCQFDINMISFTNFYRGLLLSRFFIDFGNWWNSTLMILQGNQSGNNELCLNFVNIVMQISLMPHFWKSCYFVNIIIFIYCCTFFVIFMKFMSDRFIPQPDLTHFIPTRYSECRECCIDIKKNYLTNITHCYYILLRVAFQTHIPRISYVCIR